MAKIRRTEHRSNRIGVPLLAGLSRYASSSLRRWQARRTVAVLESLEDDILEDIGIARAEIPAIALKVTAPVQSPPAESRHTPQSSQKGWAPYDHLANFAR